MSSSLFPIPSLSPFDQDVPGLNAFLGDLTAMRNYCMASDTFVSISMEAQRPAKDWFKDLFKACNCAPVFSEGILKVIPWSEISQVGNGTIYTAPTAAGPVFDFTPDHFVITNAGEPPLKVTRPRLFDIVNVVSVSYVNNNKEYNDGHVMASDTALIAQYGPIRSDPEKNEWIHDTDLAQRVAWLLLWAGDPTDPTAPNRGTISRLRYSFVLPPHMGLFEPMDLITVTDLSQGIYRAPARLLTMKEQQNMTIACEAEQFIYGAHALPGPPISNAAVTTTGVGIPPTNTAPPAINAPIIFEAVPGLKAASATGPVLFIAASGAGPNYGGCHVWMSTDGGNSYGSSPIATMVGNPPMGATANDFPIGADPDTVHTVDINLAQSGAQLQPFTQTQEDLFDSLCYVAGGGYTTIQGQAADVPYELFAYQSAALVSTEEYALGTRLRRGVYGTPIVDHPVGTPFVFLEASQVIQVPLAAAFVGMRVFFKFTAFNPVGGEEQSLSSVVAYPFTITGLFVPVVADEAALFGHPLTVEEVIDRYEAESWVSDGTAGGGARPDLTTYADDAATYGHPTTVEEHTELYEADPWANDGTASTRADLPTFADDGATFNQPLPDEAVTRYEDEPWANDGTTPNAPPITVAEDGITPATTADVEDTVDATPDSGGWTPDATGH